MSKHKAQQRQAAAGARAKTQKKQEEGAASPLPSSSISTFYCAKCRKLESIGLMVADSEGYYFCNECKHS